MDLYKYPRTPHLPWSPGRTDDDKVLDNVDHYEGMTVVVSEKMDGEGTSLYPDYIHARSLDSKHHPSRSPVKALHGRIKHEIPKGWRICGENVTAKHSIYYKNLPDFFLVFSIWNEHNVCLEFSDTLEFVELLGLTLVPTLYIGPFDADLINSFYTPTRGENEMEGYVIRPRDSFHFDYFRQSLSKFVRKGHVQTDEFWMNQPVVYNEVDTTGKARVDNFTNIYRLLINSNLPMEAKEITWI